MSRVVVTLRYETDDEDVVDALADYADQGVCDELTFDDMMWQAELAHTALEKGVLRLWFDGREIKGES